MKKMYQTKLPGLLCVAGAVILLLLAFTGEESGAGGEWVPLNDALQAKLDGAEDSALWAKSGSQPAPTEAAAALDERSGNEIKGSSSPENEGQTDVAGHAGPDGDSGDRSGSGSEPAQGNGSIDQIEGDSGGSGSSQTAAAGNEGDANGTDSGKLDINRATAAQLESLKGIGPSKAAAIVRDRELNGFFISVDDLLRVKGIGEKLLSGLKESVVANR